MADGLFFDLVIDLAEVLVHQDHLDMRDQVTAEVPAPAESNVFLSVFLPKVLDENRPQSQDRLHFLLLQVVGQPVGLHFLLFVLDDVDTFRP